MSAAPVFLLGCVVVGSVSGLASGFRHSVLLALTGAVLGFLLGIGSFLALVIPYVLWIVRYEKRHPELLTAGPPHLWAQMALPLMFATIIFSVISSWFVVGLLL